MTKFICETKNLSKKYKDFYALKNVNLTIPKGEIYGLVGENGAGKTTLIRLLTGLNFKSEGEIILFGHKDNLQHERSKIGCTIEMPALYKDMTASQNLEVQRIQRGIPNKKCITDTLELIGLSNAGKKRVANFSLGMKQRLALGVALLGEPEFLILDEPVNGLDPTGIIELRELLKKLVKEREVTILISSHILSELHQLATCYGFLHKGELLKQISTEELNEECNMSTQSWRVLTYLKINPIQYLISGCPQVSFHTLQVFTEPLKPAEHGTERWIILRIQVIWKNYFVQDTGDHLCPVFCAS